MSPKKCRKIPAGLLGETDLPNLILTGFKINENLLKTAYFIIFMVAMGF